ncbi:MAG: hypothetical protein WAU32_03410 [Thermoanaerobaculia bacterium]
MRLPLPEIALALLSAAGFAATGELLLRRLSRGLIAWNESFLVGAGASAAALFPLSLALPHGALRATLVVLGGSLAVAVARRLRSRTTTSESKAPARWDPITRLLLAASALAALGFAALNFRYTYIWDGFQIWASKAQLLAARGSLQPEWFLGENFDRRLAAYPPLVPLFEALLGTLRGFDFDRLKPVFLLFHLSLLVSAFAAVKARAHGTRLAGVAVLMVALLPFLSTRTAAGGFADMPQAAFVAGTVSAALRPEGSRALPWLIGSLTMVKSEGTLLALVAAAAVGLCWLTEKQPKLPGRPLARAEGIAVVAAFLALRLAYVRWVNFPDTVYAADAAHVPQALARIPEVGRLCLKAMFDPLEWGLLWPAFFAGGWVLLRRGAAEERWMVVATAGAMLLYTTIFLFTNWPLELHIQQSWNRLLSHIAPAAVVAAVLGYARLDRRLAAP